MSKATRELLSFIELSESEDEEVICQPTNTRPTRLSPMAPNTSRVNDSAFLNPGNDREHSLLRDGMYLDISNEEDEELQLALRLSMQDQVGGPVPPSNRGGYDDIFAMREAGRNVQGYTVPAWSLDEAIDDPFVSTIPEPFIRQASSASTQRASGFSRGTHANAVSIDSLDAYDWPFTSSSIPGRTKPAALPVKLNTANRDGADANVPSSVQPTLAEIRAARLQHFAASSDVATQEANKSEPSPLSIQTSKRRASTYKVPVGVECIDLTDD